MRSSPRRARSSTPTGRPRLALLIAVLRAEGHADQPISIDSPCSASCASSASSTAATSAFISARENPLPRARRASSRSSTSPTASYRFPDLLVEAHATASSSASRARSSAAISASSSRSIFATVGSQQPTAPAWCDRGSACSRRCRHRRRRVRDVLQGFQTTRPRGFEPLTFGSVVPWIPARTAGYAWKTTSSSGWEDSVSARRRPVSGPAHATSMVDAHGADGSRYATRRYELGARPASTNMLARGGTRCCCCWQSPRADTAPAPACRVRRCLTESALAHQRPSGPARASPSTHHREGRRDSRTRGAQPGTLLKRRPTILEGGRRRHPRAARRAWIELIGGRHLSALTTSANAASMSNSASKVVSAANP